MTPRIPRKVFVLDNYDSFTFNLVQYLGELGADVVVERNDQVTVTDVARIAPDSVVISPGPGEPWGAGISIELVRWCATSATRLLGVCLGQQALAVAFGANIVAAPAVMHGKTSEIHHDGAGVFTDLPDPFVAMRYHSLIVDRDTLPSDVGVSAWTPEDVVMGLRHAELPLEGVQFHPESVLTAVGRQLLQNFLFAGARTR